MKTYGTYHYRGHKLTLLVPRWVLHCVLTGLRDGTIRPQDAMDAAKAIRDRSRLERLQSRLEREREAKGKAIIRILR